MERSHTPLNIWFWSGLSGREPERREYPPFSFSGNLCGCLALRDAFGILHKLRAWHGAWPDQDRIGGKPDQHVEADETYIGGRTRGEALGASITRFLSLVLSKLPHTASQGLPRISGRMADMPDESG